MRLFSRFLNQNRISRYLKNKRNTLINDYFLKQRSSDIELVLSELQNEKSVVFSISFNKPKCVEVMIFSWKKYAANTRMVIVDNSSDQNARLKIQNLCRANHCLFIALPRNPEWHPNRSHALAMNWVFYNIVKKCKPLLFGYLDHDCFPFDKFDLNKKMDKFFIYGEKKKKFRKKLKFGIFGQVFVFLISVLYKLRVATLTFFIALSWDLILAEIIGAQFIKTSV